MNHGIQISRVISFPGGHFENLPFSSNATTKKQKNVLIFFSSRKNRKFKVFFTKMSLLRTAVSRASLLAPRTVEKSSVRFFESVQGGPAAVKVSKAVSKLLYLRN